MLRLEEPEVDPLWPFSAAPPDHKLPPFLHFPWEFRVPGLWNDGTFPTLTASFAGNGESIRSSNASSESEELERRYGLDIFTIPQELDSFHLGNFPPPLPPMAGLSASPLNSNPDGPGDGDVLTATAATNLRPSAMARIQPNDTAGCNNRMASSDTMSKRTSSTRGSKRLIKASEKLSCPPCDESTSTHPRLMRAPVRRSQKLGDKITALQQLVSPFGKTDTASVLHEATVCIKFLQVQIQTLSAPYFRSQSSPHLQAVCNSEIIAKIDLEFRAMEETQLACEAEDYVWFPSHLPSSVSLISQHAILIASREKQRQPLLVSIDIIQS